MAIIGNTVTRQDLVGVREQLLDKIIQVEPEHTFVTSTMGREKATNTKYEFMRDEYAAPNADNAKEDGFIADPIDASDQPDRLETTMQIFSKSMSITGRSDAVNTAGRATESGRQQSKKAKELLRDFEKMAVSLNVAVAPATGVAPKSPSLAAEIYTNAEHSGAGVTAPHTSGLATTAIVQGANRALTEALLESAMQGCADSAGETPNVAVMSSKHKIDFSGLSGLANIRDTRGRSRAQESQIVAGADLYVSNFGELMVKSHYMMAGYNYMLLLNQKYNKMVTLRGFHKRKLGIRGDSDEMYMALDAGIAVKAEKPQSVIHSLTP